MIDRMPAHFSCCIFMDSPMGINSEWIAIDDNKLADEISCLSKKHISYSTPSYLWLFFSSTDLLGTESLLFLPAIARANLHDKCNRVVHEVAQSGRGQDIETEWVRQAHFIMWCVTNGILYPCSTEEVGDNCCCIYKICDDCCEL